jgi:2-keto-4-pentenoate hydratase
MSPSDVGQRPFDPLPAAAALFAARQAGRPAGPLPPEQAPRSEADGVAVQLALAHRLGAVPPAGFKIGATAERMQKYLGLTGPAAGFMQQANLYRAGVALPWDGFGNVGVECEIAIRLGADLTAAADAEEAAIAVGELFAAIEIVENRYGPPPAGDLKAVGTPTLIADQVFHAAAVLGDPSPDWRDRDLARLRGRIFVNAEQRGEGTGGELLGHPMRALAWLAGSTVAAAFGGLRAGQVVMLGSVTPPIWLAGPCEVAVEFDTLPAVRLRFT